MSKVKVIKEKTTSFDIDCENGFTPLCPGELPVTDGHLIVEECNKSATKAKFRIFSKDMHPANAIWRATPDNPQFSPIIGDNVDVRWNGHCMSGTYGAELLKGLPKVTNYDFFIYKGCEPDLHPYSPIYHDLKKTISTGVIEWLKIHNIVNVIINGLATNFCAGEGAIDLFNVGFKVIFNLGSTRGIGSEKEIINYIEKLNNIGIVIINSADEILNV